MRLSANVGMLFTEVPLLDRFAAAAEAGFRCVESWWPLGEDLDAFRDAVRDAGVELVLLNLYGGDLAAGERGVAGDLERAHVFREHVPAGLELAAALGCRTLHALPGKEVPGQGLDEQLRVAAESIGYAAGLAARQGATIVIEPLNRFDNGPTLIQRVDDALALIRAIGRDDVGVQLDAYHAHRSEGDAVRAVRRAGGLIRHVQLADHPGRGHPGSGGAIDFPAVIAALADVGYDGAIGLEHLCPHGTAEDLAWLPRAARGAELGPVELARILEEARPGA